MQYRRLGNSGLSVSNLTLGTMGCRSIRLKLLSPASPTP